MRLLSKASIASIRNVHDETLEAGRFQVVSDTKTAGRFGSDASWTLFGSAFAGRMRPLTFEERGFQESVHGFGTETRSLFRLTVDSLTVLDATKRVRDLVTLIDYEMVGKDAPKHSEVVTANYILAEVPT